jgi:hypothetical protein
LIYEPKLRENIATDLFLLYLRVKEFSGSIDFFCGDSSVPEWDIPDGGDINVRGKRTERNKLRIQDM